jgi:L-ribulose-5-phosphate 4-epimerase
MSLALEQTGFRATPDRLLPPLDPRVELVLLARSLVPEGYDDHLAGHITINRGDGTFWCNPWFLPWDEFGPGDVIAIDLDGNVVEGDWPVPPGIPIHLELHRRRHDVGVALHHHSHWGSVWANAGRLPHYPDQSSLLGGGALVLVDEYQGAVNDPISASAAVDAMGDADMALLANHGVFVTGKSVRAVHQRAVALEHRCKMAWRVEALGGGNSLPEGIRTRFGRSDGESFIGFWEAMARRVLRAEPELLEWRPT